jgi:hypothetical protein
LTNYLLTHYRFYYIFLSYVTLEGLPPHTTGTGAF